MSDVKGRYVSSLRTAKAAAQKAKEATGKTAEERRVYDAFRRHAREDYKTLRRPSRGGGRGKSESTTQGLSS